MYDAEQQVELTSDQFPCARATEGEGEEDLDPGVARACGAVKFSELVVAIVVVGEGEEVVHLEGDAWACTTQQMSVVVSRRSKAKESSKLG